MNFDRSDCNACNLGVCMQYTFARARTRPKGRTKLGQAHATLSYFKY